MSRQHLSGWHLSISGISQLLLTRFLQNFKGRSLGPSWTDFAPPKKIFRKKNWWEINMQKKKISLKKNLTGIKNFNEKFSTKNFFAKRNYFNKKICPKCLFSPKKFSKKCFLPKIFRFKNFCHKKNFAIKILPKFPPPKMLPNFSAKIYFH